jgi:hypothetical protein
MQEIGRNHPEVRANGQGEVVHGNYDLNLVAARPTAVQVSAVSEP